MPCVLLEYTRAAAAAYPPAEQRGCQGRRIWHQTATDIGRLQHGSGLRIPHADCIGRRKLGEHFSAQRRIATVRPDAADTAYTTCAEQGRRGSRYRV
jgi:hypothetical protein